MSIRISGAILILAGCTAIGFSAAAHDRTRFKVIRGFLELLDGMMVELGCRVTPLPELCEAVSGVSSCFREVMLEFANSLNGQIAPHPVSCMEYALARRTPPCAEYSLCLRELAGALGSYDLTGQLRQLECLQAKWKNTLSELASVLTVRIRYFRILGICAGSAIAILLV